MLEPHVQAPASPQGNLLESAEAAFAEGRFAEAEAQLQQLLSEDNENAAGLILYARCLAERGELGEAETVLNAVKGDENKQALVRPMTCPMPLR